MLYEAAKGLHFQWTVQILLHGVHKHVPEEHHLHVFEEDLGLIRGVFEDFLQVELLYLAVPDLRVLN